MLLVVILIPLLLIVNNESPTFYLLTWEVLKGVVYRYKNS